MCTRRMLAIAIVSGVALTVGAPALAQTETTTSSSTTTQGGTTTTVETTTVQALPAAPPPAEKPIPMLDERTAFMVGKHTLKLGILAFEYGILQRLSIGSDPPAWALRAFVKVWVPNLHLKVQLVDRDPVWVAATAAGYYATIDSTSGASGNLVDVPLSLFASVRVHPRVYLHGEGAYVYTRIFGNGDLSKINLDGAGTVRAAQAGLMVQVRLTRIFSLTATGRYQAWTGDVPFSGTGSLDPFTTATVDGQLVPGVKHPWNAVGGIAVLWKHFHMILGAGYGNYFAPGLDIANPRKTVVPDASLSVVL